MFYTVPPNGSPSSYNETVSQTIGAQVHDVATVGGVMAIGSDAGAPESAYINAWWLLLLLFLYFTQREVIITRISGYSG